MDFVFILYYFGIYFVFLIIPYISNLKRHSGSVTIRQLEYARSNSSEVTTRGSMGRWPPMLRHTTSVWRIVRMAWPLLGSGQRAP